MSAELPLRDYQRECIDAVFGAWAEGLRRPAVVLPTGAGKTVVFSHLVKEFRDRPVRFFRDRPVRFGEEYQPGHRVMILVHRDELADQAINKLRQILPDGVHVGKVKAEQNETDADVMVCSVQTLAQRARRWGVRESEPAYGQVGLIITDECHHAAATSYREVYDLFPEALQLGVTATLARGDGKALADVWEEVVYTKSVLWMISKGFLSDVRAVQIEADFDLSQVKAQRGDWQAGDLGRAMEEAHVDKTIASAYLQHAADRPGVVFTPTVATAEAAADALNAAGVVSEVITGRTPTDERRHLFDRYRTGKVQVLVNCMVLTEGFDAPWASCAVIARPTQSNPLYVQMVGRVLRTWPGKRDALVLDVVGASQSNKLCTLVDLEPRYVRELRDGESLAEAVERETEEALAAGQPVPGSVAFDLKQRQVDLFAGSSMAWNVTPRGVMFIECGETTVFLWPDREGALSVCTVSKGDPRWRPTEHRGLDLGMAMAWGEVVADDLGEFSVKKSARWRKDKPSDAQVATAQRMGIDVTGMSRGDVSAALGVVFAGRKFDRHVGRVYC